MATTKPSTAVSPEDLKKLVTDMVFKVSDDELSASTPKEPKEKVPDFIPSARSGMHKHKETNTTSKKYSELFGWDSKELMDMEDFDVLVYKDSYWSADLLPRVPELAKFDGRVVDHKAMYPFVMGMQPQFKGFKVMLVGPTGSGKSTLAEYFCAKINQPFLRINGRQDMESDTILGKPWFDSEKGMSYKLGEWPKASRDGVFVLLDEPWKIPSGIWMTASRHLERGGIWQIDDMPADNVTDKQIVPKSSYRCVLADNVVGTGDNVEHYGATMIQDSSTLNRIDIVINVDYLKPADEIGIITNKYSEIPEHMAGKMIALLNLLRAGFDTHELSSPASIRNIEAWCEKTIALNGNYAKAFSWVLLNRYAEESEAGAVRNHYYTCFGVQL